MTKRILIWYKQLPLRKQALTDIILSFLLFWIGHFVFDFFLLNDEQNSVIYIIASATWFASFMTIIFTWTKIKLLFKRKTTEPAN